MPNFICLEKSHSQNMAQNRMSRRNKSDGSLDNDLGSPGGDDNLGGWGRRDLELLRTCTTFRSQKIKKNRILFQTSKPAFS